MRKMAGSPLMLLDGVLLEIPTFVSHYTFTGFYDFEEEVPDFSKLVSNVCVCTYVSVSSTFSSKANKLKPILGVYFGT